MQTLTECPDSKVPVVNIGRSFLFLTYFALLFWIPIETLYVIDPAVTGATVSISRLIGFALALLAALNWKVCFRHFPLVFWLLVWYVCIYTLSVFWMPPESYSGFWGTQLTLLQMLILFSISLNLLANTRLFDVFPVFFGWWSFIIAIGMLSGVLGEEFRANTGRYSFLDLDPNVAAAIFTLGAISLVGNIQRVLSWKTFLSVLAVSVLIISIFQTGSRGGMLAFIAGVLSFGLCVPKKQILSRKMMIFLVVISVMLFLLFQQFREETVMAFRLDQTLRMGDTAGRTWIWEAAWGMFLDKPMLGHGGYNNLVVLGGNLNILFKGTHNLFLEFLTTVGIIGGLPVIFALVSTTLKAWNYGRTSGNALPFALMIALLVTNSSITGHNQKIFWIIFAYAAASAYRATAGKAVPPVR